MPIHQDLIDADAQKVIRRLVHANHQAYLVGGCVRDLLLERTPKDFDIATSATPQEIKTLFRNCRIIGRRFRLAHIFFGSKIIETATFRANPREAEGDDGDGDESADLLIRRDNVFGSAEEDARRRDFTMNGLFYDLEADQVIDYVGGLGDLVTRTVRTIGDADIRFREDPVRILRAIKFAARLDFQIEESAWRAITTHRGEIPKCAPPRVLEEIYRLLRGGAARRSMELLRDTGILELLMPGLSRLVLAEGGQTQAARWWWKALDRIDAGHAGKTPTNAVLLCAVIGPFVGAEAFRDDDGLRNVDEVIEDRARPLLDGMRVSRRDSERARHMLLAQRRIAPSTRRRGRPNALVRRDYFREALDVYRLLAPVFDPSIAPDEEIARFSHTAQEAEREEPSVEGEEPMQRRRRRRGARKRRAAGGGGNGGAPPPPIAAQSE